MNPVAVRVRRVGSVQVELPQYQTDLSAGLDLRAALDDALTIEPAGRALVPTGIALAIPQGYEGQVRPRSGLALQHGVTVLNSPGTIDSDYRGEVKVLLINHGDQSFVVHRGDRIAQLVISPVAHAALEVSWELDDTSRGEGGYGSTGKQ